MLEEVLAHIEYLEGAIERFDRLIAEAGQPYTDQVGHLRSIASVDRAAAETIVAEIGVVDMTRFPTAAHLASLAQALARGIRMGSRARPADLPGN